METEKLSKIETKRVDDRTSEVWHAFRTQTRMRYMRTQLGTVQRAGTLPSCTRWYAHNTDGQQVGTGQRTKAAAVALLTAAVS